MAIPANNRAVGLVVAILAIFACLAPHRLAAQSKGKTLVVGHGVDLTGQSWLGDLLMMGGVICWATYSVASQSILKRHSPLIVIALTFSIGATLYVLSRLDGGIGVRSGSLPKRRGAGAAEHAG